MAYLDGETIPTTFEFILEIPDIINQSSAKDAGDWSVTTHLNFDGFFYQVDTLALSTSFTGTTGVISSSKDMEISNPVTNGLDSIYTLTFITENDIPANGFIQVIAPSQITIDINTTKAKGTCAVRKCTEQTTRTQIVYLIDEQTPAGTEIEILIGGMVNPRSFQPSDLF